MSELAIAIRIAAIAHEAKLDKGGNPYILHPIAVMMNLRTSDQALMAIAILHDVKEDCPEWTSERLAKEGISQRVLDALECLTHAKGENYEDYIKRIATNKDAIKVKLEDLSHNMDLKRMKGLRQKDFERMEKYTKAYAFLSKVYNAEQEVYG